MGRNALLLLNLPPDKRGLIHENDVKALTDFKSIINESLASDLAKGQKASANNYRLNHSKFDPKNTLDGDPTTYWATDDNIFPASLEIELNQGRTFDRILIQEPIRLGQRISEFEVDVMGDTGWNNIFKGTTIGYKRILRIPTVNTKKIRLKFTQANNIVAISNLELYNSSPREVSQ